MRILVMGAGAVGGYFGGLLANAGYDVVLCARGKQLDVLRTNGLQIHSPNGNVHVRPGVVEQPGDAGPCDLILFTVKSYDTEPAARQLGRSVGPDTVILSLQNGVHNEMVLESIFGPERIMSGVVYIGAHVPEPGVIEHESKGNIIFGERNGEVSERVHRFAEAFARARIPAEVSTGIQPLKWKKFLFNCALNAATAITDRRLSAIMTHPVARTMFREATEEAYKVAVAVGVDLPASAVDDVMATADAMDIVSSMQVDRQKGRRLELEAFNGLVHRLGEEHGIPVPVNRTLYSLLHLSTEQ